MGNKITVDSSTLINKVFEVQEASNLFSLPLDKVDVLWALIRSSNTQPVIVFRFEADTKSNLNKIKDEIFNKAKEYNLETIIETINESYFRTLKEIE